VRQTLNPRQAETVERLFDATGMLLDEIGHEKLTIRMVASRAGVSTATAYSYFASKDHLFAELFWRLLSASPGPELTGRTAEARLRQVTTYVAGLIAGAPALAAAVNKSLLGGDPEVARLRLAIGRWWIDRFRDAIGSDASPELLEALSCALVGAMLQAGLGISTYERLPDVLGRIVGVIMRGWTPQHDGRRTSP
jgi:AcrR family transcriptional regulator